MNQVIFGNLLALFTSVLFLSTLISSITFGLRHHSLMKKITFKSREIAEQIPAFLRSRLGTDRKREDIVLTDKIIVRIIKFDTFSKLKTEDYYKKLYKPDIIQKIGDKAINQELENVLKTKYLLDKLLTLSLWYIPILIIIGIVASYMF